MHSNTSRHSVVAANFQPSHVHFDCQEQEEAFFEVLNVVRTNNVVTDAARVIQMMNTSTVTCVIHIDRDPYQGACCALFDHQGRAWMILDTTGEEGRVTQLSVRGVDLDRVLQEAAAAAEHVTETV